MSTKEADDFFIERFDLADRGPLAGVLFAEDFETTGLTPTTCVNANAAPDLPPQPPTENDLREAYAQGLEQGRRGALADLGAQQQTAEAAACDAFTTALASARQTAGEAAAEAAHTASSTMLKAFATVLPELCSRHGAAEAEALLNALLTMFHPRLDLVIRANPHTMSVLRRAIAVQTGETTAQIQMIVTDAFAEGDIAIDWQDGLATRDTGLLQDEVRRLLLPFECAPDRATTVPHPLDSRPPGPAPTSSYTSSESMHQLTELTNAG